MHPNWIRCDGDEMRSRQLRSDTSADRAPSPATVGPPLAHLMPDSNRAILVQMGFAFEEAQLVLESTGGNLEQAVQLLLGLENNA
jgi:hypothetical protein